MIIVIIEHMSQPKTQRRLLIIPTIILIVLASAFILLYQGVKNRTISINELSLRADSIRGVDISAYQVDVDMLQLKGQGIQFIYIKATEGSSHVDDYFERNWQNAKDASLLAGAYHFFSFDSAGETQAPNFIEVVGQSLSGRLLPAVDIELYGSHTESLPQKESVVRELKAMLSALEEQYHVKPMLYVQKDLYEKYLADDFSDYPRWIRDVYVPANWHNGKDWLVWQYNDRGKLNGYSGGEKYIDLDVLNPDKSLNDLLVQ